MAKMHITALFNDKRIELNHEYEVPHGLNLHSLSTKILHIEDELVKRALIEMGWAPPDQALAQRMKEEKDLPAPPSPEDFSRMMKFYGVETLEGLVHEQAEQITRLQRLVRSYQQPMGFFPNPRKA